MGWGEYLIYPNPPKKEAKEGQDKKSYLLTVPGLLTQCARIRVPLVVMKIEKFKDLFRAALDRWLDSHESKNFGFGCTRRPIWPIFSAILPILGKI